MWTKRSRASPKITRSMAPSLGRLLQMRPTQPRPTQQIRSHNPRHPRRKSCAASMPEATATKTKNVDLTIRQSAVNSENTAAPPPTQRAAMENVSCSTRMLAGALCNTKPVRSRNVGSFTQKGRRETHIRTRIPTRVAPGTRTGVQIM